MTEGKQLITNPKRSRRPTAGYQKREQLEENFRVYQFRGETDNTKGTARIMMGHSFKIPLVLEVYGGHNVAQISDLSKSGHPFRARCTHRAGYIPVH